MNQIVQEIENLLLYGEKELQRTIEDKMVARNQLYELLQVEPEEAVGEEKPLQDILDVLTGYAVEEGIAEEGSEKRFETRLMSYITPSQGEFLKEFKHVYDRRGPLKATEYFYNVSIKSDYVKMNDIKKNIRWYADGPKGRIAITINLSKPEKDPKQVLAEKAFTGKKYPKCLLCLENLGFCGTVIHPARQTLRVVPVTLNGESWHMQYSPYLYFDEHCIVFNDKHVPMKITKDTLKRLVDFGNFLPNYFIGSNADLPIVGGSILSHDHYQGGRRVLPMFYTKERKIYEQKDGIEVSIRDWYNSVVTIKGKDKAAVAERAGKILEAWNTYDDPSVGILSKTGEEQHSTVTPIAHRTRAGEYCLDLILRNNRTDEKHPFGIFHPTEDMHNIKKESIGLIEAMGLFILPGRLKKELSELMIELQKEKPDVKRIFDDPVLSKHSTLLIQAMADFGTGLDEDAAREAILAKVNDVCFKILECTAVFKNTEEGQAAFDRFMRTLIDGEPPVIKKKYPTKKQREKAAAQNAQKANAGNVQE